MITRFAPSPTGPLHLGHAWSAMMAHDMARSKGGTFLLRIEDIDRQRSKPEWEASILEDLHWLGIDWDAPPMRQSDRMEAYAAALDDLWSRALLYSCTCTRRDIAEALAAPQEGAPMMGPDGAVYPGTCRVDPSVGSLPPRPDGAALRIDMSRLMLPNDHLNHRTGATGGEWGIPFRETGGVCGLGEVWIDAQTYRERIGDVVLARRDIGTSYHLSVVLDDAAQGVTHVVRGADLFEATPIHVLLQRLLGLPTPIYHHHDLVRDADGKRLAKRDDARSIASYREAGWSAETLIEHLRETRTVP